MRVCCSFRTTPAQLMESISSRSRGAALHASQPLGRLPILSTLALASIVHARAAVVVSSPQGVPASSAVAPQMAPVATSSSLPRPAAELPRAQPPGLPAAQVDGKLMRGSIKSVVAAPMTVPRDTEWKDVVPQCWLWIFVNMPFRPRAIAGLGFTAVVKVCCMVSNVVVQVSPYPQVRRWESRGSTGEADAAPYVSIAFGGWQWCFYGLFAWLHTGRSGFMILVYSNCLGAMLGTYYVVVFYRCCRNSCALHTLSLYLSAAGILALLQACSLSVVPSERSLLLTGLISSFCSFVGAISMLVTLPVVIRTKDSRSIPGALVAANMVCSAVWCLCGWILDDPLVTGPNVVCLISCTVCVYMKFKFPSEGDALSDGEGAPVSLGKGSSRLKRAKGALAAFAPRAPIASRDASGARTASCPPRSSSPPSPSASSASCLPPEHGLVTPTKAEGACEAPPASAAGPAEALLPLAVRRVSADGTGGTC